MMTLGPTALRVSRTRDMRVSWRLGAAGGCCRSGAWDMAHHPFIILHLFHRLGVGGARVRGGSGPPPPGKRPWPWVPGHLLFFL